MFGAIEPGSSARVIATIPEFFWELSLGIYLMVKGFKPSPITDGLSCRSHDVRPGLAFE